MAGTLSTHIKSAFKKSFVQLCLEALVNGYNETIKSGQYGCDWEEDNLSAQLIHQMKKLSLVRDNQISINPQSPLYSTSMITTGVSAKTAPVIDMKLSTWESHIEHEYYFEAKNLSETNWTKSNKAKVSATYYLDRYINTGIANFMNGKYSNGSIIGYVVQGDTKSIIRKLNAKIKPKKGMGEINVSAPIGAHTESYLSSNTAGKSTSELRHTFLDFT